VTGVTRVIEESGIASARIGSVLFILDISELDSESIAVTYSERGSKNFSYDRFLPNFRSSGKLTKAYKIGKARPHASR
jgi:hypothetical protein